MHYVNFRERAFWGGLLVALLVLVTHRADAHAAWLSRGEYELDGARVRGTLTLRADEAAGHDPNALVSALQFKADGEPCPAHATDSGPDATDGFVIHLEATCRTAPRHELEVGAGFLDQMPRGHAHYATLRAGSQTTEGILVPAHPTLSLSLVDAPSPAPGFLRLLRSGVEHILTGADHLAFLLGLVLSGTARSRVPSKKELFFTLSAFTVGHLGAFAWMALATTLPPARYVEPAVALTVAWVGFEALRGAGLRWRWLLTLPFGFVHGFALGGGLLPLGLSRADLPRAVIPFNLGVELGQLAVVVGLVLGQMGWRRFSWSPRLERALALGILVAGICWFFQRILTR
jgi:hydrogenase/urease accessory protein HupE